MRCSNNKLSAFTLIELVVGMAIASIFLFGIGNFAIKYYENSISLKNTQREFSEVNLGLKSLQKIIFENADYITFNDEAFDGGSCEQDITSPPGLGSLCYSKFGFVVENEGGEEEEYKVELVDCDLGSKIGKQLVYKNSVDSVPLFGSCIFSETNYPITHRIEVINEDIKEKIFRYYLYTENSIYKQTFFVH